MVLKMQVIENLSFFFVVFEDVVCVVGNLEVYYEDVGDLVKFSVVVSELEGLEEDFSEIERVVRGYLKNSLSYSGSLNGFRIILIG